MTLERAVNLVGDGARPFGIIFLAACIGVALFIPAVTLDKIVAVGGVLGLFVGARSWENQTQIKADALVKRSETAVTGERGPIVEAPKVPA
jgi:hypothetical protein